MTEDSIADEPGESPAPVGRKSLREELETVWQSARGPLESAVTWTLAKCAFGLFGRDRVHRLALPISLFCESALPPRPVDVIGNYIRGQVIFGHASTPEMPFRWQTFRERAVITVETAKVPKRIRRIQRLTDLEVRFDGDFDEIVEGCRRGRTGWLTRDIVALYRQLWQLGFVATIGAYRGDVAVAGLWGLEIGGTLGIMSVFHTEDHSGTVVTAAVVDRLISGDRWSVIDSGLLHDNYVRYGALLVPRAEFCEMVARNLTFPTSKIAAATAESVALSRDDSETPSGTPVSKDN